MKNDDFVWIKEASDIIGVHFTTIIHWIKKKQKIDAKNPEELTYAEKTFRCPPYTKIGSRYRFKREDIENFLENKQ